MHKALPRFNPFGQNVDVPRKSKIYPFSPVRRVCFHNFLRREQPLLLQSTDDQDVSLVLFPLNPWGVHSLTHKRATSSLCGRTLTL